MFTIKRRSIGFIKIVLKFLKRVALLPNYLRDKKVSTFKKAIIIAMLIYVFSPIDILPDPVLGFGFIDDTILAVYIISRISDELDKYVENNEEYDISKDEDIDERKIIEDVEYEIKNDFDEKEK